MTSPLISVVIPTYNRAHDLKRALHSVRSQTYPHWEVVVVDNHSTDETEKVVKDFGDQRISLHKIHNDGVIAASRNHGIQKSHGEYIAFLDSDDWWRPRKLEESLRYLNRGADVVYHDLNLVRKPGQRWFWRRASTRRVRPPVFRDLIVNGNALNNSSVVVRRELLDAVGGLAEDKSLIAIEDYDTWLRIAKVSDKFIRIPQTLGYYWAGGGTVSNPDRTLRTLDTIESRYASAFRSYNETGATIWLSYAKGKTYFRLRQFDIAEEHLRAIRSWRTHFLINLKAQWIRLLIRLNGYARN